MYGYPGVAFVTSQGGSVIGAPAGPVHRAVRALQRHRLRGQVSGRAVGQPGDVGFVSDAAGRASCRNRPAPCWLPCWAATALNTR